MMQLANNDLLKVDEFGKKTAWECFTYRTYLNDLDIAKRQEAAKLKAQMNAQR